AGGGGGGKMGPPPYQRLINFRVFPPTDPPRTPFSRHFDDFGNFFVQFVPISPKKYILAVILSIFPRIQEQKYILAVILSIFPRIQEQKYILAVILSIFP